MPTRSITVEACLYATLSSSGRGVDTCQEKKAKFRVVYGVTLEILIPGDRLLATKPHSWVPSANSDLYS